MVMQTIEIKILSLNLGFFHIYIQGIYWFVCFFINNKTWFEPKNFWLKMGSFKICSCPNIISKHYLTMLNETVLEIFPIPLNMTPKISFKFLQVGWYFLLYKWPLMKNDQIGQIWTLNKQATLNDPWAVTDTPYHSACRQQKLIVKLSWGHHAERPD